MPVPGATAVPVVEGAVSWLLPLPTTPDFEPAELAPTLS